MVKDGPEFDLTGEETKQPLLHPSNLVKISLLVEIFRSTPRDQVLYKHGEFSFFINVFAVSAGAYKPISENAAETQYFVNWGVLFGIDLAVLEVSKIFIALS